jgi:hypothetical protein
MPTRRLPDPPGWPRPGQLCLDPDHNPPSHMVFEPGAYEHECPSCGRKLMFTVPLITCSVHLVTPSFDTAGRDPEP